MKTAKMSFSNIKDVLSRDEMKQIMAGSSGAGCGKCNVPNPESGGYDNCYSSGNSQYPCLCLWRGAGTGCS